MCTYAIILVVSINHLISLYSHAIPPFFSGSFSLCCSHPTASSPEPSFIIDNSVVQLKKHKIKMRPLPSPPTALAKNQSLSYPAAAATSTCGLDQDTCKWKPYSNSSDAFEANATLILIVLFCALTCALALNTAIRCFLRDNNNYDQQRRTPSPSPQNQHQQQRNNNKPSAEAAAAAPTLVVYSAGIKLTGAEAECVICLSEFVEGDVIQVLERCKHGFHSQCIQKWLYSHYSCPICRCNCLFSPTSTPTPPQQPH
ncbi:hypothetical protein AB3S75_029388 [Citrus x aurantiifolia]